MLSIQAPEYKLFLKAQYDFYADVGRSYRSMQDRLRVLRAQRLSETVDSLILDLHRMLERCQRMNDCIQHEILSLKTELSQPEQIMLEHLSEAPCLPLGDFQKALEQQQVLDIFIEEEHTWMGICLKSLLGEDLSPAFQSLVLELQDYSLGLEPMMMGLLNLYLSLKDYGSKVPAESLLVSNPLRAFNQASVLRQYLACGRQGLELQACTSSAETLRLERLREACKARVPAEREEALAGWAEDHDDQGETLCLF